MTPEMFNKIKSVLIENGVRTISLQSCTNWFEHLQTLKRIAASRIEITSIKKEPFHQFNPFRDEEIGFKLDLINGVYLIEEYEDDIEQNVYNSFVLKPLYDLSDDGFLVNALNVAFDRIIDRQIQKEDTEEKRKQRDRITNQLLCLSQGIVE